MTLTRRDDPMRHSPNLISSDFFSVVRLNLDFIRVVSEGLKLGGSKMKFAL